MLRGSLIIYNTYGIHRARPVTNKTFVRKSVFFQVDSEIQNSEPIIVNTEIINYVNNHISMFMGFVKSINYEILSNTALNFLSLDKKINAIITKYVCHRLALSALDKIPRPV
jgi:hypothetical protein